jgi:uncharacterized membrane protein
MSEGTATEVGYASERAKAFIDAVVAIAITLLILPLMESIAEVARGEGGTAAHWFSEHWLQIQSFIVSFALIALFWMTHHRVYSRVERITTPLLWITMGWLLSIVWFPVASAMSGQLAAEDDLVRIVYIGSMILTTAMMFAQRIYLRLHPSLHDYPDETLRHGMAADIAMLLLFAAALAISLIWPETSYFPLFLLFLVQIVQRGVAALLPRRTAVR